MAEGRWPRLLPKGRFAQSVLMLSGATLAAQALNAAVLPLLTRLYSPADFGIFALYASVLGIITVVAGLRYELAVSLPQADDESMHLVALAICAAGVMAVLTALLWWPAGWLLQAVAGRQMPPIPFQGFAIGLGVLLVGVSAALQAWCARKGRYGVISRGRLAQAVLGVGTNTAFGVASPSPAGLVAGHLAYSAGGIVALARSIRQHDAAATATLTWARMKQVARSYRAFPLYSVPEALFNAAGWHLPILVIGAAVAPAELGQLLLATRIIGLPMSLLGTSVAQVFLAEAPSRLRAGTLQAFTRSTMWAMVKTSALPMLAVGVLSPLVFPVLFGSAWARAGEIVAWLVPAYVLQFASSPVSTVLHVTGHLRLAMALQAFGFAIRLGLVWLALAQWPGWSIEAYAVAGAVFYGSYCLVVLGVLGKRVSQPLQQESN